jgi:phosphatidate cytidylyltransferase
VLRTRLITGTLLVAALVALLWADGAAGRAVDADGALARVLGGTDGVVIVPFALLLLVPLLGVELARLLRGAGIDAPTWLTVAAAFAGAASVRAAPALGPGPAAATAAIAAWATLSAALVVHSRGQRIVGVAIATGGTLLAFVYVGMMVGTWLLVRCEVGPWVMAGAVLTVKASDIGAYAAGMSFGRHKMIPWLSPAKSWEGLAGGIALAAAVGGAMAWWSGGLPDPRDQVPVALGAMTGALLGIVGPFGDLVESLLKRGAGVKDSGSVLPGMGGVFDVLDSPLMAGPVVWLALQAR